MSAELLAAKECLEDVISHSGDMETAIKGQMVENDDDKDNTSYWQHQLDVVKRMVEQAQLALPAINKLLETPNVG